MGFGRGQRWLRKWRESLERIVELEKQTKKVVVVVVGVVVFKPGHVQRITTGGRGDLVNVVPVAEVGLVVEVGVAEVETAEMALPAVKR